MPEENSAPEIASDDKLLFGASDRVELLATIVMSLAAIFTAWAAFQSAKWSGEQATAFSKAGAARTESTRFDTRAGQLIAIDVNVFTAFAAAINDDRNEGLIEFGPGIPYRPLDGTLSGFWYERVRPEFRPAFDAWLELFANDRDNAPPTPFAMEEYVVADALFERSLSRVVQAKRSDKLRRTRKEAVRNSKGASVAP